MDLSKFLRYAKLPEEYRNNLLQSVTSMRYAKSLCKDFVTSTVFHVALR